MASRDFDYPHSMPGLRACKGAEQEGAQEAHRAMFERVQRAHLTECLNIAGYEVLRACPVDVGVDAPRWQRDFADPEVAEAVERDLARAHIYGITVVPALVAEGRYVLVGAQPYHRREEWLEAVRAIQGPKLGDGDGRGQGQPPVELADESA